MRHTNRRTRPAPVKVLLISVLVVAGALTAFLIVRSKSRIAPDQDFNSAGTLDLSLPFTIPCATSSGDAEPVYLALRGRDRKALRQLFSEKRMLALEKGASVRLSRFGGVVGVKVERGANAGAICFVPLDVVPVIHKNVEQSLKAAQISNR